MIKKKICMIGAFAVGKTALIQQYVYSLFTGSYSSSVGVRIIPKDIALDDGQQIKLMLWDLEGQDDYSDINFSYLKGSSGLLIVADGLRGETLPIAISLRKEAFKVLGKPIPCVLLINKVDIEYEWEINDQALQLLKKNNINVIKTSARTGFNVEEAFKMLALSIMMENQNA